MNNDTNAVYGEHRHLRVLCHDPLVGRIDTGCLWDGPVPSSTADSNSSSPAPKPEPARAPKWLN